MTVEKLEDFLTWCRMARIAVHEVTSMGEGITSIKLTDLELAAPVLPDTKEPSGPSTAYEHYAQQYGIKMPSGGEG